MEEKLVNILNEMADYLNIGQMKKLQEVLLKNLSENAVSKKDVLAKIKLRRHLYMPSEKENIRNAFSGFMGIKKRK